MSQTLALLLRLATAVLLSVGIVGLGVAGWLLAVAPEPVSLLGEPLCLLLLPGTVAALLVAGSHDLSILTLLIVSVLFYAALLFPWLNRRARRRSAPGHGLEREPEHAAFHSR